MQLRKLTVYGRLRKFLGKAHFEVAVNNPKQAFSFLINNFPELESHMADQFYKIKMGETEISEDLLMLQGEGDIKIIPVACGSLKALAGLALAGAGSAAAAATGGFFASAIGTAIASGLTAIGTSMLIDGVSQLIAPTPTMSSGLLADQTSQNDPEAQANFGFNSITNTSRAGVAVPILYGEVFTGSVIISSGIDTVQVEGTA